MERYQLINVLDFMSTKHSSKVHHLGIAYLRIHFPSRFIYILWFREIPLFYVKKIDKQKPQLLWHHNGFICQNILIELGLSHVAKTAAQQRKIYLLTDYDSPFESFRKENYDSFVTGIFVESKCWCNHVHFPMSNTPVCHFGFYKLMDTFSRKCRHWLFLVLPLNIFPTIIVFVLKNCQ